MGLGQKQRQTLAEWLIHKVCSWLHADLARLLFVRAYNFSPCIPLLLPLRESPESQRDDELDESQIFLPSNPPVHSAGAAGQ